MAKLIFDDGKEVTLSKETEKNLRKELLKPKGFEKRLDNIRVSTTVSELYGETHPVRISILDGCTEGRVMGGFPSSMPRHDGGIPGCTIQREKAKKLAQAILDCVEYIERNDK